MRCVDAVPNSKTEFQNGSGEKSPDISARSYQYALRAIALYQHLQKQHDGAGWIIGKQFLKSATSIGANIEEAQGSESRADFIHKIGIAQKEARESLFWLRLLSDSRIVPRSRLEPLMRENQELIAVITTIVVNTKRKRGRTE
ncbi:MAG TPA: four helix bundle protein [Terriglobia bacterium]|nr:four helix bundle protein [Terriglobia bacterium]